MRKIVYHCYGGAHSSVVAANIHVGELPRDKVPSKNELLYTKLFDSQKNILKGKLHYFGRDTEGNHIYSCGMGSDSKTIKTAMVDILQIYDLDTHHLKFVDTLTCVNVSMRVGGFLSQRLGLIKVGRPLVLSGTQKAYLQIAGVVKKTKNEIKNNTKG
ncbi:DUF3189 family protein [Natranaerobius trueperi]|uniref:Uncharacterized protein n=1 Tax=Natranaerobius trueperi TaxID=759412 RepID=A0A226BXM1_9FIRM|nr:DUF3189 family protein [Natranaerobius trueperi]OWZ82949.1 hypothetical protein CDO51_11240 [Natranaerobius trueperi]